MMNPSLPDCLSNEKQSIKCVSHTHKLASKNRSILGRFQKYGSGPSFCNAFVDSAEIHSLSAQSVSTACPDRSFYQRQRCPGRETNPLSWVVVFFFLEQPLHTQGARTRRGTEEISSLHSRGRHFRGFIIKSGVTSEARSGLLEGHIFTIK